YSVEQTIDAETAEGYIRILANPESGLSPLAVTLAIRGTFSIGNSVVSYSGPEPVEFLDNGVDRYPIRLTAQGIYYLTAEVTDSYSNTHTDTVAVLAQNASELNALLQAKWNGMKAGMLAGDIETALSYITSNKQGMYAFNFNLLQDHLAEMEAGMQELTLVQSHDGMAECTMVGEQNGQQYSFYVVFEKDSDGIWRIRFF
ncbi:MAG: hypothetical protein R6X10_06150, partial [Desulfobacterales bacterium]